MKSADNLLETAALGTGAWMIIMGILVLGPVGFLLLLTVFYSMVVQNLALGVIAGLFFFSPLIFLIIWASFKWASVLRQRAVRKSQLVHSSGVS
jgi:hypothetical protein